MKKYMLIPLICLMLMSSTCEDNDHYYITFENLTDYDIYLCTRGTTSFDGIHIKCNLGRFHTLEKNSTFKWSPFNISIEREMGRNSVLEFYCVNPDMYNEPSPYDCDSIPIKNDILMHYELTLKDLQRMNWRIVYPPEE